MTDHKDIHEAINAVMQEVGYVQKQSSKELRYTYAGEAALIEAVRPSMVAHGIYMKVHRIKKMYRTSYETKNGTNMFNTVVEGVVRFTHTGGTYTDAQAIGEGSDAGDKSANKAMTGLYKYALRQTFCIETGDDPDQFSSELQEKKPASGVQKAQNRPQNGSGTTKTESPAYVMVEAAEALSGPLSQADLRKEDSIEQIKAASGKTLTEILKVINELEGKYTIGQVVKLLTGDTE